MELFRDEFLPNIQGASYHPKWVAANPSEAAKWVAFRDAVLARAAPAPPVLAPALPVLASKYGKALIAAGKMADLTTVGAGQPPLVSALPRRGQVSWAEFQAVGTPAQGPGSPLPTREVTLPSGATAYWLIHDSPNTQIVGDAIGGDKHRIVRWGSGGLYSGRLMYAVLGFRLTLNGSNPGRMFDFHTQPNDAPWGWTPPCSGSVAPFAIDYRADAFGLQAVFEPEDSGCSGGSGNYHFTIMTTTQVEAARGSWIWLWLEVKWGRRDTPGFPGGVRAWIHNETAPRVDVQGINTHWSEQNQITLWEGQYWSTGASGNKIVQIAATRLGTTPQKAYEDVPVLYTAGAAGNPGGTSAVIASRLSTEASVPPTLQW